MMHGFDLQWNLSGTENVFCLAELRIQIMLHVYGTCKSGIFSVNHWCDK